MSKAKSVTPELILPDSSPRWTLHRARITSDALAHTLAEKGLDEKLIEQLLSNPSKGLIAKFPRYVRGKVRFLRELVMFVMALERKAVRA